MIPTESYADSLKWNIARRINKCYWNGSTFLLCPCCKDVIDYSPQAIWV